MSSVVGRQLVHYLLYHLLLLFRHLRAVPYGKSLAQGVHGVAVQDVVYAANAPRVGDGCDVELRNHLLRLAQHGVLGGHQALQLPDGFWRRLVEQDAQLHILERLAWLVALAVGELLDDELLQFLGWQGLIALRQHAQRMLRTIFHELHLWLPVLAHGQQVHAVPIVFLRKRHWQCAARIACPVGAPDALALVYVSAGHVVGMPFPLVDVHLLLSADDYLLARVVIGNVGAMGVEVRHHYRRLVGIELAGTVGELPQKAVHAMRVALVGHYI